MLTPERRQQIWDLVLQNKSVLVKDLSVLFDVTGETIRKDLAVLEAEGKVLKTYGGAYICDGVRNELPISLRETLYPESKESIGAACAGLVKNGDTVTLDESTTCLYIAKQLLNLSGLTILTNSLRIADLFTGSPENRLILSGGELDHRNQCFTNRSGEWVLNKYYVDKCFVSCRGLDMKAGITDGSESNGIIRRIMLERSKIRYLVVDKTKLNLINFYRICGFDSVDTLVIDELESESWRTYLQEQNINLIETMKEG